MFYNLPKNYWICQYIYIYRDRTRGVIGIDPQTYNFSEPNCMKL